VRNLVTAFGFYQDDDMKIESHIGLLRKGNMEISQNLVGNLLLLIRPLAVSAGSESRLNSEKTYCHHD
jgi:hypothetical protein